MNFRGALQTFEVIGVARDVRTANLSRIDPSYVYLPLEVSGRDHAIVRAAMAPRDAAAAIRAAVGAINASLLADLQITSLEEGPLRLSKAMTRTIAGFGGTLAASRWRWMVSTGCAHWRRGGVTRSDQDGLAPGARTSCARYCGWAAACRHRRRHGAPLRGLSAVVRASLLFPGTPDLLFGVSAFDAVTFAGVTALLAFVTLAASAGPLWRATRVDPVIALRQT